ncbi:MAG: sugar phosphate isomerase/epimerase [Armatimonadetes bacterium]|nr:sugar phosphate isomerase/epimerase [Armatimonadota bacterium]
MGSLPTKAGERVGEPLGIPGLLDAAMGMGLAGVELGLPSPETLPPEAFGEALAARGLRVVLDFGVLAAAEAGEIRAYLQAAAALGARVVRVMLSRVLCGDRRALADGWEAHLQRSAERLREVLPFAEDHGLCLAMENHQDATSDDLLRLAEMTGHSPAYGVTLDTGNPLAVAEDPVEYARRIAPLIRHVHLKDYTLHFAPEGYRLVRCAAGDGVIDFPAILGIIRRNGHDVLPGIEIGAQATRTIPLLEPDWWACYPPTTTTQFLPALCLLWEKGRPQDEPYSSAWERGADSATVAAEEWDVLRRSVAYFQGLTRARGG